MKKAFIYLKTGEVIESEKIDPKEITPGFIREIEKSIGIRGYALTLGGVIMRLSEVQAIKFEEVE